MHAIEIPEGILSEENRFIMLKELDLAELHEEYHFLRSQMFMKYSFEIKKRLHGVTTKLNLEEAKNYMSQSNLLKERIDQEKTIKDTNE